MGLTPSAVLEAKPQKICSVLSEFALEYRTCRERVLQQIQKKANHRERNKTRGKMITEVSFIINNLSLFFNLNILGMSNDSLVVIHPVFRV